VLAIRCGLINAIRRFDRLLLPQQWQAAKDIIVANVQSFIEQLEAGYSDVLAAYLDAMSRFHTSALATSW